MTLADAAVEHKFRELHRPCEVGYSNSAIRNADIWRPLSGSNSNYCSASHIKPEM
jgi:hypothetical protein